MLIYNVRSILDITRRQTLANSLALQDIDIVCLSETWLTSAISNNSLFLNQFNVFRGDRPSKSGDKTSHGGTLIALSKQLISKEIQLLVATVRGKREAIPDGRLRRVFLAPQQLPLLLLLRKLLRVHCSCLVVVRNFYACLPLHLKCHSFL